MVIIRQTRQAKKDLEGILGGVDGRSSGAAERYAVAFAEKADALTRFPEMGRLRPELAPNLRSVLVFPYVLFYRITGETVQIIRILHGKRNLKRILRRESED